jgi:CheY-like chemotaxis protein
MDPAAGVPGKTEAKRVLVVDDDPVLGRLAVRMRRDMGLDASATTSPKEALGLARRSRPDLVLADVQMPELDGSELCRLLRGDPDTRALPVILCSGLLTEDLQRSGATACLEKPFTRESLLRTVRSVLGTAPESRESASDRLIEG